MKDVILLFGGVLVVNVILCELIVFFNMLFLKVEGVSLFNNVRYEDDGICVWKVYGIGFGKFIKL